MSKILSVYAILFSLFIIIVLTSFLMTGDLEFIFQAWQAILVLVLSLPVIILSALVLRR
jgi:hypothetical protein